MKSFFSVILILTAVITMTTIINASYTDPIHEPKVEICYSDMDITEVNLKYVGNDSDHGSKNYDRFLVTAKLESFIIKSDLNSHSKLLKLVFYACQNNIKKKKKIRFASYVYDRSIHRAIFYSPSGI